jgi:hypothetical protein
VVGDIISGDASAGLAVSGGTLVAVASGLGLGPCSPGSAVSVGGVMMAGWEVGSNGCVGATLILLLDDAAGSWREDGAQRVL